MPARHHCNRIITACQGNDFVSKVCFFFYCVLWHTNLPSIVALIDAVLPSDASISGICLRRCVLALAQCFWVGFSKGILVFDITKVKLSAGYTKTHLLPPTFLPFRSKTITNNRQLSSSQSVKTCNFHQVKVQII